ncbi:hypothetical protein DESC_320023 [Desulfosarcina cetonica]|nr:hypothetical protein DESC_320023 [Desulfosarcina cetonica]
MEPRPWHTGLGQGNRCPHRCGLIRGGIQNPDDGRAALSVLTTGSVACKRDRLTTVISNLKKNLRRLNDEKKTDGDHFRFGVNGAFYSLGSGLDH